MDLEGKVSIITGGASGIGAACSRAFAKQGARVIVADVNEAGARAVAEEIGGLALRCDVGDEAEIDRPGHHDETHKESRVHRLHVEAGLERQVQTAYEDDIADR